MMIKKFMILIILQKSIAKPSLLFSKRTFALTIFLSSNSLVCKSQTALPISVFLSLNKPTVFSITSLVKIGKSP